MRSRFARGARWFARVGAVGLLLGLGGCSSAAVLPAPSSSPAPSASADGCRPTAVYPLRCGTFRSTFGGSQVRGGDGGPQRSPLEIEFRAPAGRLQLLAEGDCLRAVVPMRLVADDSPSAIEGRMVAERAGEPSITSRPCGEADGGRDGWARSFLRTRLRTQDGGSFGRGEESVYFEYQGAAGIGQPQPPRNDLRCVAAHVRPFDCRTYRSTAGSGGVAFLGARPYRLTFAHVNGQVTAGFSGRCNAISVALQTDGTAAVATGGAETTMLCEGTRGSDDHAVADFFRGVLTSRQRGDVLTFTSARGSATFRAG